MPLRNPRTPKTVYSLSALLSSQPPAVKRTQAFAILVERLNESGILQRVRLNSLAWKLLNTPRLKIKYLDNFYRTYRLPRDQFFSQFLKLKWQLVDQKAQRKLDRAKKIAAAVKKWPPEIRAALHFLAAAEKPYNSRQTLTAALARPLTIKRAVELSKLDIDNWEIEIENCLNNLRQAHPILQSLTGQKLLNCALLGCLPKARTGKLPPATTIRSQFRALSKIHHPDAGGDADRFRELKTAFDQLINNA